MPRSRTLGPRRRTRRPSRGCSSRVLRIPTSWWRWTPSLLCPSRLGAERRRNLQRRTSETSTSTHSGEYCAWDARAGSVRGLPRWTDHLYVAPLLFEELGGGGRAMLQNGEVFLREGVHLLALDVDGAHDLPSCTA